METAKVISIIFAICLANACSGSAKTYRSFALKENASPYSSAESAFHDGYYRGYTKHASQGSSFRARRRYIGSSRNNDVYPSMRFATYIPRKPQRPPGFFSSRQEAYPEDSQSPSTPTYEDEEGKRKNANVEEYSYSDAESDAGDSPGDSSATEHGYDSSAQNSGESESSETQGENYYSSTEYKNDEGQDKRKDESETNERVPGDGGGRRHVQSGEGNWRDRLQRLRGQLDDLKKKPIFNRRRANTRLGSGQNRRNGVGRRQRGQAVWRGRRQGRGRRRQHDREYHNSHEGRSTNWNNGESIYANEIGNSAEEKNWNDAGSIEGDNLNSGGSSGGGRNEDEGGNNVRGSTGSKTGGGYGGNAENQYGSNKEEGSNGNRMSNSIGGRNGNNAGESYGARGENLVGNNAGSDRRNKDREKYRGRNEKSGTSKIDDQAGNNGGEKNGGRSKNPVGSKGAPRIEPGEELFPITCSCTHAPKRNGICYDFIPGSDSYCKERPCMRQYICVGQGNSKLTCIRRKTSLKIVPTGLNTCTSKPMKGYMYVPYASE